jgi:hypothetical protein
VGRMEKLFSQVIHTGNHQTACNMEKPVFIL